MAGSVLGIAEKTRRGTSKVLVVQATVSFLLIIFLLSRLDGIRACYSDLDGLMHFISQ